MGLIEVVDTTEVTIVAVQQQSLAQIMTNTHRIWLIQLRYFVIWMRLGIHLQFDYKTVVIWDMSSIFDIFYTQDPIHPMPIAIHGGI